MGFLKGKRMLPPARACLATLAYAMVLAWAAGPVGAQTAAQPANLTSTQIVEQIHRHSQLRSEQLKQYKALRHYDVEYHGFATRLAATMDVEETYDAAEGKSFRVVAESGSSLLREKVLKREMASEKEASLDKASFALSEINYRFHLDGTESIQNRPSYVLDVEPLTSSKFLFRGRIWVDAEDFAVVKMETEPARNPSMWISRTLIHSTSAKTGGFWMPQQVRSETKVRVGGTAVLTIDYKGYEVHSEDPDRAATF